MPRRSSPTPVGAADATLLPHLQDLLRHCAEARTTNTATLAERMCLSRHTVNTYFQRAKQAHGVGSRSEILVIALERFATRGAGSDTGEETAKTGLPAKNV